MRDRLEDLRRDARHGLHLLLKHRSFTIVAALTLALGIGATTAIFSVLEASVLAPLPFPNPERLVMIAETNGEGRQRAIPVRTLDTWRETSQTLDEVSHGLMGQVNFTVTGPGGAERIVLEQVDYRTLSLLGVPPVLGRTFQPDEVLVQGNTAQTIVISYGLWQRMFGGAPDVIGKRLPGWSTAWGEIIIGVMPEGFYTHPSRFGTDAWYLIAPNPGATIGRLAADASVEQAQTELEVIARGLEPEPATAASAQDTWSLNVVPLHDVYRDGYSQTLYMLLGAVGFVLLIAAVNVANLQLNRGVTRQTEMATRIALGAGRWRLFRQLVIENLMLVLAGGALGLLVALVGIRLFVRLAPNFYPPSDEIGLNGTVLLFTLAVCVATAFLSGLVPGFRASKPDLHTSLKQGARGSAGGLRLQVRRVLVVAEIALAMILLVGAGLMINSYARVTSVEMGLDPDNVLTLEVSLMGMDKYRTRHGTNHYEATPEIARFHAQALQRLAAIPGVESVGATSVLPPGGAPGVAFQIIGRSVPQNVGAEIQEVSPDFFSTMRIPLRRGRTFSGDDHEAARGVVIVNETFAREFFGGEDPIGQSIQVELTGGNPVLTRDRLREVVGVVGDVRTGLRSQFGPTVYVPYQQHLTDYPGFAYFGLHAIKDFAVRTSGDPLALVPAVRQAFAAIDPDVAVTGLLPMRATLSAAAGQQSFWMRLLGIFAGLGVFLAAIGIYGVVSYSVEQRTHEFGIRTTMGAQNGDIMRLVLGEGLRVTLIGLAIGIAGAYAATRLIEGFLFGVTRMDPMTIAAVAVVLLGVSLLACYIPSRRTMKLDPLLALRVE